MIDKVIGLGGEPATGKTTIIKKLREFFNLTPFSYGQVKGVYDKEKKVYFIGVFDGSTFEGTDKLSMAVQPFFIKFLNWCEGGIVIFEGDRLFNQSLFDRDFNFVKIIIKADEEILESRHKERGDTQSNKFLKSKKTKIENIIKNNKDCIIFTNEGDDTKIIKFIKDEIWNSLKDK